MDIDTMQDIPHAMDTQPSTEYDVVIVGGGMVGAAAAIGLGQLGLTVAVIEAREPQDYDPGQPLDVRVSAISVASEQLLTRLGVMEQLLTMRHAPYDGLETWEMDGCLTSFTAEQVGQTHLGYFFENRLIQLSLWQQIRTMEKVALLCPHKVSQITRQAEQQQIEIILEDGSLLSTRLLVGADGANSQVRQWSGIGVTGWDYAQSAMLINIHTQTEQQSVTWQQFTPAGPRSLLPLPGNNASLVWYDDANRIKQLSQLTPLQLAEQIKQHFPARLDANFSVENSGSFTLTRRHAQRYYQDNLVILGDAAHTINPLAGQGVNIGFKDVDVLVAQVANAIGSGEIWWEARVLKRYQQARYYDNQLMMTAMDAFYASFSNDLLPLKLLRNGALKLANIDSPIKRKVLKYALGLN
ncbi:FAD-dependent monooxygenase [Shewanella ulleungensis]|uniref:2-octaprenyl-3-methyl-6-methoxy-1,4-benzoquinol hydroxylase n=1 Tax=Shewanella ulleungensis TaxID=2282699 RepID=A0ABQ2QLR1_9GAMM|nr:FAD-dependent monooxygenase [Shewanella ulleungensis]MCL1150160.1 FAD-dependent monooxygenase [Shewanella ulleungensis]GGP86951.1 2-octaprenyl-3-methyl-6-methoxy-1,4-benzoquinol hydroxylase [Shewanella ulleungensis]